MRTKVYGKKVRGKRVGGFNVFGLGEGMELEGMEREGVDEVVREVGTGKGVLKEKPGNVGERTSRVENGKGLCGSGEKEPCADAPDIAKIGSKTKGHIEPKKRTRLRGRKSPPPAQESRQNTPVRPSSPRESKDLDDLAPLLQQTLTLASPQRELSNAGFKTTTRTKPTPNPESKPIIPSAHPATTPPRTRAKTNRPQPPHPKPPTHLLTHLAPLLACPPVCPTPIPFPAFLAARPGLHLQKIGEGSFGEVYRATLPTPLTPSTPPTPLTSPNPLTSPTPPTAILKLIPLAPPTGPGARSLTPIRAATSEVRLLAKMQRVPGFVEFCGACVVLGAMPAVLVREWVRWRREGGECGSWDPRKYGAAQAWLVVEMGDAGEGLEGWLGRGRGRGVGVERVWDIWWQTVLALAKAEVYAEFEHRDLHLGNLCVREVGVGGGVGQPYPGSRSYRHYPADWEMMGRGESVFGLRNTGVEVTIIDYSLSRARGAGEGEGEVLFTDFLKGGGGVGGILRGVGDTQYDVYRYMAEEMEGVGGKGWEGCKAYRPRTNVLWLAYLVGKLLEGVEEGEVGGDLGRKGEGERKGGGESGAMMTRTRRMREVLETVRGALRFEDRKRWGVGSAGELVEWAVREGWLREEEVLGG